MKERLRLYARCFFSLWHIAYARIFNISTFKSSPLQDFSASTKFLLHSSGKITLGKGVHTKRNVLIHSDGGNIEVGEGAFFNSGCMLVSKENIKIGSRTSFGPNVLVYDHDHNIRSDMNIHDSGFVTEAVIIGNDVWIGANSVILRGSVLGDGCVVGAGSVIKGKYPPHSVIIQKRSEEVTVRQRGKEEAAC